MRPSTKFTLLGFALALVVFSSIGAVTWMPSHGTFSQIGGTTNAVSSPRIVSTSTTATVFDAAESSGGPEHQRLRLVQNIGTVPVIICLGTNASLANIHAVLGPCIIARDGRGDQLDVSYWRGTVTMFVESGTGVVAPVEVITGQ